MRKRLLGIWYLVFGIWYSIFPALRGRQISNIKYPIPNRNRNSPISLRGFTLVELLAVVILIGIMSVLAIPNFEAMFSSGGNDRAFRLIQGALIRAQELAVLQKKEQVILFDLDTPSLMLESRIALPPKVKIRITMPDAAREISSGEIAIRVDRYGNLDPFKIALGDLEATANPFTGLLEK